MLESTYKLTGLKAGITGIGASVSIGAGTHAPSSFKLRGNQHENHPQQNDTIHHLHHALRLPFVVRRSPGSCSRHRSIHPNFGYKHRGLRSSQRCKQGSPGNLPEPGCRTCDRFPDRMQNLRPAPQAATVLRNLLRSRRSM